MTEALKEYALIAEIISAIAIIISLVFVGMQIKENTKATRASTFHEIASLDIHVLLSFANSEDSANKISTFRENPDALSSNELNHAFYLFAAEVRHVENMFLQHQNKMLSERDWRSRKALVDGIVLSLGFGALLENPNKKYFDGTFIEYGENLRKVAEENA